MCDIEGHTFAFLKSSQNETNAPLIIASLPDFVTMREIDLSSLKHLQQNNDSGWQGLVDLALSPDETKVAVLFRVADALAYKDDSSYFDLGAKCLLAVFDINSGQQIVRASRWTSDRGLCWFPDSDALLFASYNDESLYQTRRSEVRGNVSYGIGYAQDGRFKTSLFSINLSTGEIRLFGNGLNPTLIQKKRQFAIREEGKIRLVDLKGTTKSSLDISLSGYEPAIFSPSGNLMLIKTSHHQPLRHWKRLMVIDVNNTELRHIITNKFTGQCKWTTTGDEVSAKGIHPLP